jgi:polyisoprenoid-binding protein YceI
VIAPLPRRALLAALAPMAAVAQPQPRYVFDAAVGRLEFNARHLGMFSSTGRFERFQAVLDLDPARPTTANVDVTIETGFVSLAFPGAVELLRSEPFFDTARFPTARFTGRAERILDPTGFPVQGDIALRGVTRPLSMTARLAAREREGDAEIARFEARGRISRSAFGMVAERTMIADEIGLFVEVRLRV